MSVKSSTAATELNVSYSPTISCTCTECTTFLRPILPSKSYYPRNFSHLIFPAATTSPHAQTSVWIDKLSLAAYDTHIVTPVSVPRVTNGTNGQQRLSIITSTTNTKTKIRSAFPKTPGTLRCSNPQCQTRIPATSHLITTTGCCKRPLCDEHSEQLFNAEEHQGQIENDAASPKSAAISEIIDSYQRSGAESNWESKDSDGARRPRLSSRASSSASWRSFASWESNDAEFEWDARAFASKLCW